MNVIPLSLYIHFPWCIRKCPYCDFNSHELKNDLPEKEYINRLLEDLDGDLKNIQHKKIHSIFMGGGPYVGFGLSGSAPLTTDENGQPTNRTEPVHFGSGENDIHNPDFGVNFIGGYQFTSNVTLSIQYGLGLQNLSNNPIVRIHNQALGFSVGYFFK